MRTDKYHVPLEAGGIYHVFNRANNDQDLLFVKKENYYFFLERYAKYLRPFVDTYAYCLIPNHFHLLIEVKQETEIRAYLEKQIEWKKMRSAAISLVLSEAFRRLFVSYAKSLRKTYVRRGSVFQREFGRTRVDTEHYFYTEVFYIHNNPIKHGLASSLEDYPWSSYLPILYGLSYYNDWLCRQKMLEWFDGEENFKLFHRRNGVS